MDVVTSYISNQFSTFEDVILYAELYPQVITQIQNISIINGFEHEAREITFKGSKIRYSLFYSPSIRKYFLSFIPKNVWTYSNREVILPAFQNTVDLFKRLPDVLDVGDIQFNKTSKTGVIDITNWGVSTVPDCGVNRVGLITELKTIKRIGTSMIEYYTGKIRQQLLIIDATNGNNRSDFIKLLDKISVLFEKEPQIMKYTDSTLEEIEIRMDKKDLFIIILKYGDYFDPIYYRKYKLYFISNEIPSQVIDIINYDKIINWGFENLILELLKKAFFEDKITLDPQEFGIVDGFLCLSDIENVNNDKLFGISITYSGKGTTNDWLEIYNDVDYQINRERIMFEKHDIKKLTEKIIALSTMENTAIDIYVTKRWSTRDVGNLTQILSDNNIMVRRFFYLSKKTNRFLYSELSDSSDYNLHSYTIWDGRIASIQSNSKITLYGTMFPIHVELLNPWTSGELMSEDLKLVLWLTKKRIYRIMNFYNLKLPEILTIFDQINYLNMAGKTNKMRISLHSLI